jgi:hypothetical protein
VDGADGAAGEPGGERDREAVVIGPDLQRVHERAQRRRRGLEPPGQLEPRLGPCLPGAKDHLQRRPVPQPDLRLEPVSGREQPCRLVGRGREPAHVPRRQPELLPRRARPPAHGHVVLR